MKSQKIRIRNLPQDRKIYHKIQLKPITAIFLLLVLGFFVMFMKSYLIYIGLLIILIAVFALFVMPDKILCEFTDDYLVLYNDRDKERCNMVYYEDIVSWQYEWHANCDQVVFNLVDGSSQFQDMYAKYAIKRFLDEYLPNKEVKKKR